MKRFLIAVIAMVSLSMSQGTVAQNHRHAPRMSVTAADTSAINAFSDTTAADTMPASVPAVLSYSQNVGTDSMDDLMSHAFGMADEMVMTVLILFILFVFSPVAILIVLFYFLYKSRKQKIQLAEMAMKNGLQIPDNLFVRKSLTEEDLYRKGIRTVSLGLGLGALLWFASTELAVSVGLLLVFIGAGKIVIAKTSVRKKDRSDELDDMDNNRF